MQRRNFLLGAVSAIAGASLPRLASANVPKPYSWDIAPPMNSREAFIGWMVANRGEDPRFLGHRWSRFEALVHNKDVLDDNNKRAFLLVPREEFVLKSHLGRSYDHAFLDIGYGVTISGPHVVSRMTTNIDVQLGEKVLEIGTGSGYQSAYLANLSDQVFTIKNADGYFGWEEEAPFDKIIVTCGIDHIPPPLLQQLKVGGIMVIPVGPPGAQRLLKVVKDQTQDGTLTVARSDIYNGRIVPFVAFTKLEGDEIKGTHNNPK